MGRKTYSIACSTIAAAFLGGATLFYVPVSCGCVSPAVSLMLFLGMQEQLSSEKDWNVALLEAGFSKKLAGQPVDSATLPSQDSLHCVRATPTRWNCHFYVDESLWRKRGFAVDIHVDPNSLFKRVEARALTEKKYGI